MRITVSDGCVIWEYYSRIRRILFWLSLKCYMCLWHLCDFGEWVNGLSITSFMVWPYWENTVALQISYSWGLGKQWVNI